MAQAIGPNQEKWLQALESGEHEQCRERLGFIDRAGNESNCCLGVAARIFGVPKWNHVKFGDGSIELAYGADGEVTGGYAPRDVVRQLALHTEKGQIKGAELNGYRTLTSANDFDSTFAEIAAFCRANPEAVFTEPR